MKGSAATIIGLALVAGAAIFVGRSFLVPHADMAEAANPVLAGAYEPQLVEMRFLEDAELPPEFETPGVDDPLRYVQIVLLYPHVVTAPDPREHILDRINGDAKSVLHPVHTSSEADEDGVYVTMVYRTTRKFDHARLTLDRKPVFGRIDLE